MKRLIKRSRTRHAHHTHHVPVHSSASFHECLTTLLKSPMYLVVLVAVTAAAYAFADTHFAVGIDDLAGERYFNGELIAQGRFTWPLIAHLFNLHGYVPLVEDVIGSILIALGALLFSALFMMVSHRRFDIVASAIFSAIFVSCPLPADVLLYQSMGIAIGGCFILVALSLALAWHALTTTPARSAACLIGAIAAAIFAISWYESSAVVYVCAALFCLLLADEASADNSAKNARLNRVLRIFGRGALFAGVLGAAILAEGILDQVVMAQLAIEPSHRAANHPLERPVGNRHLLISWIFYYCLEGLVYAPVALLDIAFAIIIIVAIAEIPVHRSLVRVMLYLGLIAGLASITFLLRSTAEFRTAQAACLISGIALALIYMKAANRKHTHRKLTSKRVLVPLSIACASAFCIAQVIALNQFFMTDWDRYLDEASIAQGIAHDIEIAGLSEKPVVFTGNYRLMGPWRDATWARADDPRIHFLEGLHDFDRIDTTDPQYALPLNGVGEYLSWGMKAFESQDEEFKFFAHVGCPLVQASAEQVADGRARSDGLPIWPQDGSIVDEGDYIIVHLGDTYPHRSGREAS